MIVILCDSFEDARNCFAAFMDFLETFEALSISKVFEYSYCVETDDDLRYIFVDYRFKPLFREISLDYIDSDEFFEGIDIYYFGN